MSKISALLWDLSLNPVGYLRRRRRRLFFVRSFFFPLLVPLPVRLFPLSAASSNGVNRKPPILFFLFVGHFFFYDDFKMNIFFLKKMKVPSLLSTLGIIFYSLFIILAISGTATLAAGIPNPRPFFCLSWPCPLILMSRGGFNNLLDLLPAPNILRPPLFYSSHSFSYCFFWHICKCYGYV